MTKVDHVLCSLTLVHVSSVLVIPSHKRTPFWVLGMLSTNWNLTNRVHP